MRGWPILLALLLAGCAQPGAPSDAAPPSPADPLAVAEPFDLAPGDILEALVEVEAASAAAHVPPGFLLSAENGRVSVVVGAARCGQGARSFLAIPVTIADARLEGAEGTRHFFEPEHLVDEGELAIALARVTGNATMARIGVTAAPPLMGFVVEGEAWTHRVEGVGGALAPSPNGLLDGVFREWFPAPGGYGYLEAQFASDGASVGATAARIASGEGTVTREVVGASAVGELIAIGESAYADATIGFVPFP